jgi:hypothetical protein
MQKFAERSSNRIRWRSVQLGTRTTTVGAAIVGSAIITSNEGYYYGYRRCGWVRQFDAFGNYIGRVRTCNY